MTIAEQILNQMKSHFFLCFKNIILDSPLPVCITITERKEKQQWCLLLVRYIVGFTYAYRRTSLWVLRKLQTQRSPYTQLLAHLKQKFNSSKIPRDTKQIISRHLKSSDKEYLGQTLYRRSHIQQQRCLLCHALLLPFERSK